MKLPLFLSLRLSALSFFKSVGKSIAMVTLGVGIAMAFSTSADAAQSKRSAAKKQQISKAQGKAHAKSSAKNGKRTVAKGPLRHGAKQVARSGKPVYKMVKGRRVLVARAPVAVVPPKPSFGQLAGLHGQQDPLELKSSVAYVIDQDTREVLVSKNDNAVLPIASLTKLMTGVVVSEAKLKMNELIAISQDDVDTEKGSRSRLKVGTELTRGELLHLALMSSENRAAHALGRSFPGGMPRFVSLMNTKAQMLGMKDTQYVEPTGLSSRNQSSAQDLAILVGAASADPLLREYSTSQGYEVMVGNRMQAYNNTNRLIKNPEWEIGLQKTGYISEAGQCLVMQTKIAGRKLIMVFLDSAGKLSRLGDAERVRKWVELNRPSPVSAKPVAARAG